MRKLYGLAIFLISIINLYSQEGKKITEGIITGSLVDSATQKPVSAASVKLISLNDNKIRTQVSEKSGRFAFTNLSFGYYSLNITSVGFAALKIDSIYIREERFDFNLADIKLSANSKELQTVIVYAEKPLIQSKDGNITFNAGESALAAGSNASELLSNVPLVTKDADGKLLVRGKEPKILIDDKPVELNLQQLQDLLESMPGSLIEKIEVMTNPPPQYANEAGGVIHITTRKGKVGAGGRISISAGTRGEGSVNGNFNYRKNKFAVSITIGQTFNRFEGNGYSYRKNIYTDSTNYFNTRSNYLNKNNRPNFRINTDYEIAKNQTLNLSANYNLNDFDNRSTTGYTNINRYDEIYRLSERTINSRVENSGSNFSISYTLRGNKAGEQLRVISGAHVSFNENSRLFYQQFFNPGYTPNGTDSTQKQITDNRSNGYHLRVNYDKPLGNKKTFLSLGTAYNRSHSHIIVDASFFKKPEGVFQKQDLLSNDFKFHQHVTNARASVKQVIAENFSVTAGLAAEATIIGFELLKDKMEVGNHYFSFLPFGNISKNWKDKLNLSFSYRRTIRRPGITELNPTIDFSDPYNIRFGNYQLDPSLAHNFDVVLDKTKTNYFLNLGFGYNIIEDIFSPVRTLLAEGKTQVTWENISNRSEYEISTWNGYTINKKLKINLSASYVYNRYGAFEKKVRKFRDGGSFTTTLNSNYSIKDIWNFTGNFTTNRFANPQGSVSWNLSMNVGIQKKFFEKKLIATLNFIDPFRNQQRSSRTYGSNFELQSFNSTQTKNVRLTLVYNFVKPANPLKK